LEELGDGFQIPVRVVDMYMAEICREHRQEGIDRASTPIAVDERADCEAMTIMPTSA
jgi:hypothetical protein